MTDHRETQQSRLMEYSCKRKIQKEESFKAKHFAKSFRKFMADQE